MYFLDEKFSNVPDTLERELYQIIDNDLTSFLYNFYNSDNVYSYTIKELNDVLRSLQSFIYIYPPQERTLHSKDLLSSLDDITRIGVWLSDSPENYFSTDYIQAKLASALIRLTKDPNYFNGR